MRDSLLPAVMLLVGLASARAAVAAGVDVSWRPDPPEHAKDLVERVYVEDGELPTPTADETERGFVLYARPATELVFPNSVPAAAERVARLTSFASPDEYEPIVLAVYALGDLKSLEVRVGPLRQADGPAVLPADLIDVRVARGMFKRTTHYSGPGEFMYMPTWLARHEREGLAAGRSAWFWLIVRVPPDAKPGRYLATATISADRPAEVPIELTVLPIELPRPNVSVGFYDSPTPRKLRQQRAHGMTSVGWHGNSGVKLSVDGDSVAVDLKRSAMGRVIEQYGQAGFRGPIMWLMGDDVWKWCTEQAPADSKRCADLYVAALRRIGEEARRRDWPEIIVQPDDECPGHPDRMARSERRLPLIKAAGFRTEMDHYLAYSGGDNAKWVQRTMPYVDIITLRYWPEGRLGQAPWAEIAKTVADAGKELCTYNITACHMFPQPASMRFSTGWFFRTAGSACRGMYFWAYSSAQGDPYNDLDGKYSDFRYHYPPDAKRGLSGGPSIDLVCMREGLDDLRYIQALESLIAKNTPSPAATTAKALLARLRDSFDFTEARKRKVEGTKSAWQFLEDRDGLRIARGWYRHPNGWTSAHYETARQSIASQIIRLQSGQEAE